MPPPEDWMIEEWNVFQVARWLGVAPWELLEKDPFWLERAKFYMSVEAGVNNIQKKKVKG